MYRFLFDSQVELAAQSCQTNLDDMASREAHLVHAKQVHHRSLETFLRLYFNTVNQ